MLRDLKSCLAAGALLVFAGCTPGSRDVEPAAPEITLAWTAEALGALKRTAEAAPAEGLPSEAASLAEIERYAASAATDQTSATQLDVAADALFASLARSFAQGATLPERADPEWLIPAQPPPDVTELAARASAGESPEDVLRSLLPQSAEYVALREELARVSAEAPGAEDGDGRTREARLAQLRASMERWRWLPREMPLRRVEAHVPQLRVTLVEDGQVAQSHAAIVGARRTQTPAFVAAIRSVTLNPYWEPPSSILLNELLPQFRRDPNAAARGNYEVLDRAGRAVALSDVDWSARPFPYRVRQRPGGANSLGHIRFDLPNPHAIYLHDTPSRGLFNRADRALSHGCIRVQDPVSLAAAVLDGEDEQSLRGRIAGGDNQVIALAAPLPIYVLYITATLAPDGAVAYAEDLYGRDAGVIAALDAPDASLAVRRQQSQARCGAPG